MQKNEIKALITGGVSGLGLAVARRFVAEGGQVALLDINDAAGAAVVGELGDNAVYYNTNVTDENEVIAAVDGAVERMGGINVAMNCAGVIGAGRVLGREGPMPLDFFSNVIMINLVGSFNVAKAAAAAMEGNEPNEDGERGVIINTASVAAYEGQIGQAAYSASKAGIVGMTLPIARELLPALACVSWPWRPEYSGRPWWMACRNRSRSHWLRPSRSRNGWANPRNLLT